MEPHCLPCWLKVLLVVGVDGGSTFLAARETREAIRNSLDYLGLLGQVLR